MMYYSGTKPHLEKNKTRIEIINESAVMILNYHMVSFSDYNLHSEAQFNMGYSYVIFVAILVVVNLCFMLNTIF